MTMTASILDNGDLEITAAELVGSRVGKRTATAIREVFAHLILGGSQFEWALPHEVGCGPTGMPILAVFAEPKPLPYWMVGDPEPLVVGGKGNRLAGSWIDKTDGQQKSWFEEPVGAWILDVAVVGGLVENGRVVVPSVAVKASVDATP